MKVNWKMKMNFINIINFIIFIFNLNWFIMVRVGNTKMEAEKRYIDLTILDNL